MLALVSLILDTKTLEITSRVGITQCRCFGGVAEGVGVEIAVGVGVKIGVGVGVNVGVGVGETTEQCPTVITMSQMGFLWQTRQQ